MNRHERRIRDARALRDRLTAEGRHTDARIVGDLARSSSMSMALNRMLHAEVAKAVAIAAACLTADVAKARPVVTKCSICDRPNPCAGHPFDAQAAHNRACGQ